MGAVDFVVGLDSGCGDYERLWATTSLRGLAGGTLTRRRADRGRAFGRRERHRPVVVSDRARRCSTGSRTARRAACCPRSSTRRFPTSACGRRRQAAAIMGETTVRKYPFAGGTQPMIADHAEALLNRTWRPALSVTGADGFPAIADAGNVLRPRTSLKLSLRLPPPVDGAAAMQTMKRLLEADPPHGATRALRRGRRRDRMERPADRAVARAGARRRVERVLRQAVGRDGRGRHDPVHGDARQAFSGRAVPDHRRARTRSRTRTGPTSSCTFRMRRS